MGEYRQACPNGSCWMCVDHGGALRGNGSAQTNPTKRQSVENVSPVTENAVRYLEDVA